MQDIITQTADIILEDVDYDIYKEDLEEREILSTIEYRLQGMLTDICNKHSLDEILDFINL